jgi:hypothetical protein
MSQTDRKDVLGGVIGQTEGVLYRLSRRVASWLTDSDVAVVLASPRLATATVERSALEAE